TVPGQPYVAPQGHPQPPGAPYAPPAPPQPQPYSYPREYDRDDDYYGRGDDHYPRGEYRDRDDREYSRKRKRRSFLDDIFDFD
ncbi:MAG TPA: transcriptional regulator, partial [Chloroflexia bacterium]|nr:transcriptional regulator [Chloroflexia bacterium]